MTFKNTTAAVALTLSAAASAFTASPLLAADAPSSPLFSAKTIQVHEVYSQVAGPSSLVPVYTFDVKVIRPGKVKVLMSVNQDKTGKPNQYIDDGKVEREYNSSKNTFTIVDPKTAGSSHSQLRGMSMLDKYLTAKGQPEAGSTRAITTETVNGQAFTVISDKQPPRQSGPGKFYVVTSQLWISKATKLPIRNSFMMETDGKTRETGRMTFSNWVLNKPIPAAQVAWNPPAGVTLGSEPKLLAAGAVAPDFAVQTADGKTVHLSDFKGKIVVLDLWATWCGPCQASMPHLDSVYKATKDQDVQVLAVCVWDKKEAYDKWLTEKAPTFSFPTYFENASNDASFATTKYGVTGIPTQYVIDKDGKIAASNVGYGDGDHRLEEQLKKLGLNLPATTASAETK
ncbi:MAG: TlpA disulfide reductase family protein [Capsulimonas sp.]|uniref:TlpA disulfide reductase family protein n=1 Tax=Capsulimonas sp. TaxID=2494211 RepID=UPI0032630429